MCRALANSGHEVRVFSTEARDADPYTVRSARDGPVRVDRVNLPYFRSVDPDGWQLGLRRWREHERKVAEVIGRALEEWRPHLAVYSTARPLGEEGILAVHRSGVPIVGMLHEAWLICPRIMLHRSPVDWACSGPGPAKCLECMYSHYDGSHGRAALKMAWRIPRLGIYPAYRLWRRSAARRRPVGAVTVSEFMVNAHRGHIRGPITHVPVGVNLSGLPSARRKRPRSPLRFGFMGGFQPNKGIWHVLDAAAALKALGLNFEVHVWGPGQEKGEREISLRDLGDRIRLRGMYAPDELWNVYSEIDVAIIATTVPEPFGRIPIEAAACGVPTIGANIGGIPESIRHEVNGLLYNFRDVADLTRQMRRVLEEPRLYERLREELSPPVDTRDVAPAVEAAYRAGLANAHRWGALT